MSTIICIIMYIYLDLWHVKGSINLSELFSRKYGHWYSNFCSQFRIFSLSIDCSETKENDKWLFYDHFRPFFGQLHDYISQNWGSDGHFEVLNRSKPWLIQKLWLKIQIFPFLFFSDIVEKMHFCFLGFWVLFAFCVITVVPIMIQTCSAP